MRARAKQIDPVCPMGVRLALPTRRPDYGKRGEWDGDALREARGPVSGAGPGRRHGGLPRTGQGRTAALRDRARERAHPRTIHPRALSPAHRQGLLPLRQQRPLPAEHPREPAPARIRFGRAPVPPDGPDRLVCADRARPVEPAPRARPRPLRAPHVDGRQDAPVPETDRSLGGSGADPARRPVRRPARSLAHPGPAGPSHGGLPSVPRALRRARAPARSLRPARLRGPHRRAGPDALQPLLHDGAQVLPGARHDRAGQRDRLGRCARGALRGRPRHGRGSALARRLRDGLPGELGRPRRR